MPKKSKVLRELEAMEEAERKIYEASKSRLETIQMFKDRLVQAATTKPKARRMSVRVGKPGITTGEGIIVGAGGGSPGGESHPATGNNR